MATYVNDLRLKEIATGDESGTWGASTNTNLELIAEAFSFGTEAITTNADTHTTTIADGSTDPGRSIYLKYTGALDSDCTITIGHILLYSGILFIFAVILYPYCNPNNCSFTIEVYCQNGSFGLLLIILFIYSFC